MDNKGQTRQHVSPTNFLPGHTICYSDYAMNWTTEESWVNYSKCKRFSSSPKHLDRLWGPPSLYSTGTTNSFSGDKAAGVWSWSLLPHLVPRLRISGGISPLPLYTLMACTGKMLCFTSTLNFPLPHTFIFTCYSQMAGKQPLGTFKQADSKQCLSNACHQ